MQLTEHCSVSGNTGHSVLEFLLGVIELILPSNFISVNRMVFPILQEDPIQCAHAWYGFPVCNG